MKLKLFFIALCLNISVFAQKNEQDFYNPNKNGNATIEVRNLTGGTNNGDSNTLNRLISDLSTTTADNGKKGGTITLYPNGSIKTFYLKEINIKSNVHLKIHHTITILPQTVGSRVFEIGDKGRVYNVALTSINENATSKNKAFKVRLRAGVNEKETVLKIANVRNFKVSGINILDRKTKISGITMAIEGTLIDKSKIPVNGVVKNLWIKDAHVGYGLIQAQASKNVLYKNLNGEGGITLRFESGNNQLLQTTGSSVDRIFVEGVSVKNGDAALNISPHRSNQGSIDAKGVKAINSTWAVQASKGFISSEGTVAPFVNNKGSYRSVKVVIAEIKGGFGAQIKGKDIPRFKCDKEEKDRLKEAFTDEVKATTASVVGNSIGGSRATASVNCSGAGCYNTNITYPSSDKITGSFHLSGGESYGDDVPACTNSSVANLSQQFLDEDFEKEVNNVSVSPNPTSTFSNITAKVGSIINVYNSVGVLVSSFKSNTNTSVVNVSNFMKGVYMVHIISPVGNIESRKLIVN